MKHVIKTNLWWGKQATPRKSGVCRLAIGCLQTAQFPRGKQQMSLPQLIRKHTHPHLPFQKYVWKIKWLIVSRISGTVCLTVNSHFASSVRPNKK